MKLPLCAVCGRSLTQRSYKGLRVFIQYRGLPGRPSVGWCEDHYKPEELLHDGNPLPQLRAIQLLGPGRLVAGKGWKP